MRREDKRQRQRVRLGLPVRVRQIGPPRDILEVTQTLDVSRNGMRIQTREPYHLYGMVWITLPYHSNDWGSSPEFPASIVRIAPAARGNFHVGVRFHNHRSDPWQPADTRDAHAYTAT